MDIHFELYKIFYHAAYLQSFSQAAEKLYISQSAVSQAIKNLEKGVGSQLFIRSKRNLQLTTEGEILFRHVEQAFNFIKTAEAKLSELKGMNSGEIRIGVGDTICKYFLIPRLEKFNSLYPGIKIGVVNRTSSQILELLGKGLIDLGIVTLPVKVKNINVMNFMDVEDIFVASSKFAALKGRQILLDELSRQPLLMLPKDSATRRNFDELLSGRQMEIQPEIELESVDLLLEFAKIGLGIAHVLKESAVTAMEKDELFQVDLLEDLPQRRLGIAVMDHVPLSKASNAFIDFLK